jgi:hypothetical protein
MSITNTLFKLARLSATGRAISKGPEATGKRMVRIGIGRAWAKTGIPRWPK